jgi:uncharacterized damage-inducible protein DinB
MGYGAVDPTAGEKQMLVGWLDFHRDVLRRKCAGLDTVQLRVRSVPPSTLTLLGLLRHMADVERHWFRRVFTGERVRPLYWTHDDPDADFTDLGATDGEEALAAWQAEVAAVRPIVTDIDDMGQMAARGHSGTAGTRPEYAVNLRWILVHMIEEYARHNGHADLLREAIDGQTGV